MEEKFLVSGGIPRKFGELLSVGHALKQASLAEVDFSNKIYTPKLNHITAPELCVDSKPTIGFTTLSVHKQYIYVCTSTEVLVVDKITYEIVRIYSEKLFHDLHHVNVINNKIFVVNTGMDTVFEYDMNFKNRKIYHTLGNDPFHKFSPNENLNKIVSTKPHETHTNNIFEIDGEPWITRMRLKEAVALHDHSKKMEIGVGRPHDGIVKGDFIYFTTVNGYIVVFNKYTFRKEAQIELNSSSQRRNTPLGWCRSLHVDDDCMYVGFTQLRTTKFSENLGWLKTMVQNRKITHKPLPTRIEKLSLNGDFISEFILPTNEIYTIFSIHKL